MNHKTALAARVAAFNKAHAEINRIAPLYRAALAPFIGQHITTAQGEYLAKVKKTFPASPLQVFSPHKGCFVVKVCEPYGDHTCVYAEPYFYACTVSHNGNAEALSHEFEPLRTDYTVESVQDAREAAEVAREAARQAENACAPFGQYDR